MKVTPLATTVLMTGLLCAIAPSAVRADTIRLSTGRTVEGIIVEETPSTVTIQVLSGGFLTFDRSWVKSVALGTEQDQRRFKEAWLKEAVEQKQVEAELKAKDQPIEEVLLAELRPKPSIVKQAEEISIEKYVSLGSLRNQTRLRRLQEEPNIKSGVEGASQPLAREQEVASWVE